MKHRGGFKQLCERAVESGAVLRITVWSLASQPAEVDFAAVVSLEETQQRQTDKHLS